ncbi:hypothetical protein L0P88_07780 [Muricauda sp. SCSIO 64092]|uniref:hypothetical protein n=1 Tax=Allomuricauda sp. SCSIO 64092 TaxID=2908842 RepID=UPI001FF694F6|nr:hypothetical protein [Muricauda sp. SCSIO 64092]UOY08445.1 hypothetical protein L0P88_07780 [Muricauda sp. SCSIO 64092]
MNLLSVRDKHLSSYLDDFDARINTKTLSPQGRFNGFLEDIERVLSYNYLTSNS